jgi:hypothetical protein
VRRYEHSVRRYEHSVCRCEHSVRRNYYGTLSSYTRPQAITVLHLHLRIYLHAITKKK